MYFLLLFGFFFVFIQDNADKFRYSPSAITDGEEGYQIDENEHDIRRILLDDIKDWDRGLAVFGNKEEIGRIAFAGNLNVDEVRL